MKTKRKVLKSNNLPARLPLATTLLWILALDHFNAPQWMWGVVATAIVVIWIKSIVLMSTDEPVDLLNKEE